MMQVDKKPDISLYAALLCGEKNNNKKKGSQTKKQKLH